MKKNVKIMAVFLTIIMLVSILAFAVEGFNLTPIRANTQVTAIDSDNKRIAGDISNITGVDIEEVLAIKNSGKSWNEVLDKLKSGNYQKGSSISQRENLLTQTGIVESDLRMLKEEGFNDDELQQAKLLVERMIFQLQEITANENSAVDVTGPGKTVNNEIEDLQKFRDIAARIDIRECLYLVLKLQNEFGSLEKALDEYLFSLQAEIDLALCVADREEYFKQREEKNKEMDLQSIITASKIEDKMLDLLGQKKNINSIGTNGTNAEVSQGVMQDDASKDISILPDIPIPETGGIKPENPADRIRNEINVLDPMKSGNGGIGQ